jgi:serine/threonine protein kinase
MTFSIGENVGPYRIVAKQGQGGMATVYKAYHASLDRYVAIKVLHPAFKEDPDFLGRFQREAKVLASLEHPSIVPIYDFNEHGGNPYLVMRFVEGETLKVRLARDRLHIVEILHIVESIGNALDYAHSRGVLHRDIKPSNIILTDDGRVYLTDYGLARIAESTESTASRDTMMGTPQYISPEQARGDLQLDAGTDIYSLGVVLYELVVGRVPFSADTPFAVVHDHIFSPLPLPSSINPHVPEAVEQVLLTALAKARADRYKTAGEMVRAFKVAVEMAGRGAVDAAADVPTRTLPRGKIISTTPPPKPETQPDVPTPPPSKPETQPSKPTPPSTRHEIQLGAPTAPMPPQPLRRQKNAPWILAGLAVSIVLCVAAAVSFGRAFNEVAEGMVAAESEHLSVEEAQALAEANPDDPTAFVTLGWVYYDTGDYDEAGRAFEQALSLGPDDPEELLETATALGEVDRWSLAMDYHAALFPLDPTAIRARQESYSAAESLLRADYEAGRLQLEQITNEVPGWGLPDAALALHELQRPTPNISFAAERAQAALESEPDSPLAHFAMGRVCEVQNDAACAQTEYGFVLGSTLTDPRLMEMAQSHLDALGDGS